jgi:hypothetical protein
LIRDLVIAPLARESGLLQLHGLLLRICLLGFELSLSVPHLVLPILRGGDGPVHHGVEVGVDLNSNHGPQLRVKTTEKRILFLLIGVDLIRSIARQLRGLV